MSKKNEIENEIELKLRDEKYGFGFVIYRTTKLTWLEFDKIKAEIIKSFDKILKEFL